MSIFKNSRKAVVAAILSLSAIIILSPYWSPVVLATPPCSTGRCYPSTTAYPSNVYSDKQAVILAVPVGVPVAKVTGIVYSFDAASAAYLQPSTETLKSDEEKRIDRIYEGIKRRTERDAALATASSNPLRVQNCAACHSPGNAKGGLDITGELSADVATACISRILEDDESLRMPRVVGHLDQAGNLPPESIGKLIKELNSLKGSGSVPVASRPKAATATTATAPKATAVAPERDLRSLGHSPAPQEFIAPQPTATEATTEKLRPVTIPPTITPAEKK